MPSFGAWKWRMREYRRALFLPLLSLLAAINWFILHIYVHGRNGSGDGGIFLKLSFAYAALFAYLSFRTCFCAPLALAEIWNKDSGVINNIPCWVYRNIWFARLVALSAIISFLVSIWFVRRRMDLEYSVSRSQLYYPLEGHKDSTMNPELNPAEIEVTRHCDALMGFALVMHSIAAIFAIEQLGGVVYNVYGTVVFFCACWIIGLDIHWFNRLMAMTLGVALVIAVMLNNTQLKHQYKLQVQLRRESELHNMIPKQPRQRMSSSSAVDGDDGAADSDSDDDFDGVWGISGERQSQTHNSNSGGNSGGNSGTVHRQNHWQGQGQGKRDWNHGKRKKNIHSINPALSCTQVETADIVAALQLVDESINTMHQCLAAGSHTDAQNGASSDAQGPMRTGRSDESGSDGSSFFIPESQAMANINMNINISSNSNSNNNNNTSVGGIGEDEGDEKDTEKQKASGIGLGTGLGLGLGLAPSKRRDGLPSLATAAVAAADNDDTDDTGVNASNVNGPADLASLVCSLIDSNNNSVGISSSHRNRNISDVHTGVVAFGSWKYYKSLNDAIRITIHLAELNNNNNGSNSSSGSSSSGACINHQLRQLTSTRLGHPFTRYPDYAAAAIAASTTGVADAGVTCVGVGIPLDLSAIAGGGAAAASSVSIGNNNSDGGKVEQIQFGLLCLRVFSTIESFYGCALPLFVDDDPEFDVLVSSTQMDMVELLIFLIVVAAMDQERTATGATLPAAVAPRMRGPNNSMGGGATGPATSTAGQPKVKGVYCLRCVAVDVDENAAATTGAGTGAGVNAATGARSAGVAAAAAASSSDPNMGGLGGYDPDRESRNPVTWHIILSKTVVESKAARQDRLNNNSSLRFNTAAGELSVHSISRGANPSSVNMSANMIANTNSANNNININMNVVSNSVGSSYESKDNKGGTGVGGTGEKEVRAPPSVTTASTQGQTNGHLPVHQVLQAQATTPQQGDPPTTTTAAMDDPNGVNANPSSAFVILRLASILGMRYFNTTVEEIKRSELRTPPGLFRVGWNLKIQNGMKIAVHHGVKPFMSPDLLSPHGVDPDAAVSMADGGGNIEEQAGYGSGISSSVEYEYKQCWLYVDSQLGDQLRLFTIKDRIMSFGVPMNTCQMFDLYKYKYRHPVVVVYEEVLSKFKHQLRSDLAPISSTIIVLCEQSIKSVEDINAQYDIRVTACLSLGGTLNEVAYCVHWAAFVAQPRAQANAEYAMEQALQAAARPVGIGSGIGSGIGGGGAGSGLSMPARGSNTITNTGAVTDNGTGAISASVLRSSTSPSLLSRLSPAREAQVLRAEQSRHIMQQFAQIRRLDNTRTAWNGYIYELRQLLTAAPVLTSSPPPTEPGSGASTARGSINTRSVGIGIGPAKSPSPRRLHNPDRQNQQNQQSQHSQQERRQRQQSPRRLLSQEQQLFLLSVVDACAERVQAITTGACSDFLKMNVDLATLPMSGSSGGIGSNSSGGMAACITTGAGPMGTAGAGIALPLTSTAAGIAGDGSSREVYNIIRGERAKKLKYIMETFVPVVEKLIALTSKRSVSNLLEVARKAELAALNADKVGLTQLGCWFNLLQDLSMAVVMYSCIVTAATAGTTAAIAAASVPNASNTVDTVTAAAAAAATSASVKASGSSGSSGSSRRNVVLPPLTTVRKFKFSNRMYKMSSVVEGVDEDSTATATAAGNKNKNKQKNKNKKKKIPSGGSAGLMVFPLPDQRQDQYQPQQEELKEQERGEEQREEQETGDEEMQSESESEVIEPETELEIVVTGDANHQQHGLISDMISSIEGVIWEMLYTPDDSSRI